MQKANWRKSSFSGDTSCVEWSVSGDVTHIRDSKDPDGPVLAFNRDEVDAFIQAVTAGEFS